MDDARKPDTNIDNDTPALSPELRLSIVVPARNEAASLAPCLQSLVAQSEPGFALGAQWELIVIDDESSDATRQIAESFASTHPGIEVLAAPPLDLSDRGGFTGKTNACWFGAQQARGASLLFTDADTIHQPGNLSRALHEEDKYGASLLSYSPRQIVTGFWQRAVMPLVFSELASVYPPKQISSPESPLAAANGQFLMIERDAYFAVGGHRTVGRDILEDVALARAIKRAKYRIRFRYAPDALATRMYKTLPEMIEGWTKNLALLFPNPLLLASWRVLDLLLFFGLPVIAFAIATAPNRPYWQTAVVLLIWVRTLFRFYGRVARSNFPAMDVALSILGIPFFVWLLVRSSLHHQVQKSVAWKGRSYKTGP
ncbi:MAG: glycosyltransferase [Acidobacteriota bacterium]|nr:glycosyltransferase [Acidobacteriota bacterium]